MKRNPYTSNLTKAYIESHVSQVTIMSKYLDIPVEVINDCIENNTLIPSVFRDDDVHGSMGFTYNKKGRLKVRDFGGFGFFEDVYGCVAYILSLAYERKIETNNKQDFYFILKHIAYTFKEYFNGISTDENLDSIIKDALVKCRNSRPIIEIAPRSWNKQDKDIWGKWGINLNYLNTHFVLPVDQYYINRGVNSDPKYRYSSKDPCYAYMLGQDRKGICLIKLYFPLRDRSKELKFITNCNVLEGLVNLELNNYDYILITKSSKDRLSIGNQIINHPIYGGANAPLRIGVINLPSENYKLKQKEYDWLVNKLSPDGHIISLLDFDATGRCGAKYMCDVYNIPYIFITRGELGLPNYEVKDFAELYEKYSQKDINQFITETITYAKIRYNGEDSSLSDEERLLFSSLPY